MYYSLFNSCAKDLIVLILISTILPYSCKYMFVSRTSCFWNSFQGFADVMHNDFFFFCIAPSQNLLIIIMCAYLSTSFLFLCSPSEQSTTS